MASHIKMNVRTYDVIEFEKSIFDCKPSSVNFLIDRLVPKAPRVCVIGKKQTCIRYGKHLVSDRIYPMSSVKGGHFHMTTANGRHLMLSNLSEVSEIYRTELDSYKT